MMNNTVSVKEAIIKGKIYLILIPCLIIFGFPVLGFFLVFFYKIAPWVVLFFIIIGIVSGCLFWCYKVVEWKIWAYENVRNVHELKRKAIRHNLIHSDNSWFNKTEILNDYQRLKLQQLEKKFLIEDIHYDDPSIPSEIKVNYSKLNAVFNIILFSSFILLGFAFIENKNTYFGWGLIIIGIYFIYKNLRKLFRINALFKMDSNGITTPEFGSLPWNIIPYCYTEQRGFGKHAEDYFVFFAIGKGSYEVLLNETNISMEKLEDCIKVYRIRFEKSI